MKNITKLKNNAFAFLFIIYSFTSVINWTQLATKFSTTDFSYQNFYFIIQLICVPFLFIIFCLSHPRIHEFIAALLLITYSIYVAYVERDNMLLMFVTLFFAARNSDVKYVLKKDLTVKIVTIILVFVLSHVGYLYNLQLTRDGGQIRQTFGFNYPTYLMYAVMLIGIEYIIIRNKEISYFELAIISIIGFLVGKITDARGEIVTLFIVVIGSLFINKVKIVDINKLFKIRIIRYLIIVLPEIMCLLSYICVAFLKSSSSWYTILNKFASTRLDIFQYYFNEYGLRILPAKLDLNYLSGSGQWISVIDNCYLYLGIELGIISLLIFLGIFSFLIHNAIKNQKWIWLIIMLAFAILYLVEYVSLMPAIAIYCLTWKDKKVKRMRIKHE